MTGYIPYRPGSEVRSGAAGHSEGPARGQRVMPHISDLKARAEGTLEQAPQAIGSLLEVAQQSTKQIGYLIEVRRPDLAYIEYLVASEIVLNRVPSHRDAPIFREDRGRFYHLQKDLVKKLTEHADQFDNIKEIIINDNKRSGVRPTTALNGVYAQRREEQSHPNARYSMPNATHRLSEYARSARSSMDASSQMSSGRSTPVSEPYRNRPPANPKPYNLHSRAINGSANGASSSVDSLSERFAKLRTSASRQGNMPGTIPLPVPEQFNANGKPMGPRNMSNDIYGPPQLPPKLPLNTSFAGAMPQEPSPAYSPARNMSTPASINPPRSTVRSMVGTGGRNNSMAASSASAHAPNTNGDSESYFPSQPSRQTAAQTIRRKSVHSPKEFQITAEKLYDYLKPFNVLLIDLRSREEFDDGHIYVRTIMNIEPTALRPNMSASELQEALVLSPDMEQVMFERRNEFDLVVYYDQSTSSASFLNKAQRTQSEATLKYLYDALYEFNADKPLQRPPILLMGGLDAWADLLGQGALTSSNTAAIVSNHQNGRPARPISRVPNAKNGQRFYIQKKRLRDYNPLEPEEEEQWRQRARSERAASGPAPAEEEDDDFVEYHRTTEDFMRRFPDTSTIEAQSMTSAPAHSYPKPPPLPSYAAPPVPTIPSRPVPAASRPSYSGVHDRNVNHNQSVTRSTVLPSYFPLSQNIRLPRTGLVNFGVTCYMNATIQCLNATLPLTSMYRDGTYQKYIQKENWRGSRGLMSENYATLIQNMWQEGGGPCRPKTLRELCSRVNGEWGVDRQQDAKEFFDFLVDVLHEDLNVNWSHPPAQALTELEEARRERLPKPYVSHVEWQRSCLRDRSLLSEIFGGQYASRLRCLTCNFTSTTFEPFYSISVEIPRDQPSDIRDCLRSYCSEERLQGDELWRCPHCKVEREATKQITITRAPRCLVLHLKRFSASHNETARKVRTPIEFPLQALDISPYMLPPITPAEEQSLIKRGNQQELQHLKVDPTMNGPYLYSSYAVMRHQGNTLTSGHYVAMVRDKARGVWWQFNDDRVTEFKPEALTGNQRLQNEQAYLLFYERDTGALGASNGR